VLPVLRVGGIARRKAKHVARGRDTETEHCPIYVSKIARHLIHLQDRAIVEAGSAHIRDGRLADLVWRSRQLPRVIENRSLSPLESLFEITGLQRAPNPPQTIMVL